MDIILDGQLLKIAANTVEYEFSVYGDKIVWADSRNGNEDIYLYDISLGKESKIIASNRNEERPSIYENKIVYLKPTSYNYCGEKGCSNYDYCGSNCTKKTDAGWAVFLYDLDTTEDTLLFELREFDIYVLDSMVLDGGNLVFSDSQTNSGRLFLFNIKTKEKREILNNNYTYYFNFDIYGNKIVWDDRKELNYYGIYVYDIDSNETKRVVFDKNFRAYPKIYGNKVVWLDRRNLGDADVYLYDLTTGKERAFGGMGGDEVFPDIYENKIVYSETESYPVPLKGGRIYLYDLDKEKLYYLTDELNLSSFPKIYGNNIAWQEFNTSTQQWDIYLFKISES